jgi:hypothetical protein
MKTFSRSLIIAGFALAAASPAFAGVPSEITLYDQPQQQDGFLQGSAGSAVDVLATGSIAAPRAFTEGEAFWEAREAIREHASDHD